MLLSNIWHKGEIAGLLFPSKTHRKMPGPHIRTESDSKLTRQLDQLKNCSLNSRVNYWKADLLNEILQLKFSIND